MSSEFSPFDHGETVGASDDDAPEHVEATVALPDEVSEPESLSPLQRRTIQTAVLNRDLSTHQIGELVGKEGSYVAATLRRKCPRWYYEVFEPEEPRNGHRDARGTLDGWIWGREVNEA